MDSVDIIYEDAVILVLDKPSGVVVNRAETTHEATLQDELSVYFSLGSSLGIGDRAGIVHRLDRETSGLLVVAKTPKAFRDLQAQFKNRLVEKEYLALVHGHFKEQSGTIEAKIARIGRFGKFGIFDRRSAMGREARTNYKVVDCFQHKFFRGPTPKGVGPLEGMTKSRVNYLKRNGLDYTFLRVFPKTGRTHQIRVHLKSTGHPVVSDLIYCPRRLLQFDLLWCLRLFLHASKLEFAHPGTGKRVSFESDLPKDLENAILNLNRLTTNA